MEQAYPHHQRHSRPLSFPSPLEQATNASSDHLPSVHRVQQPAATSAQAHSVRRDPLYRDLREERSPRQHEYAAAAAAATVGRRFDYAYLAASSGERDRDPLPPSTSLDRDRDRDIDVYREPRGDEHHLRDFVHGPPPLRRLSAPSVSLPPPHNNSAGPLPPLPSPSALARHPHRSYLPPPSLAPRSHAPPPAISIPTLSASAARYADQPQTAPLQHSSFARLQPPPPRSAGLRPASPAFPPSFARQNSHLAPPYGGSATSSASSSIGLDERALRSPHPPLTAIYPQSHQWPPPLASLLDHRDLRDPLLREAVVDDFSRPYRSSPLADAQNSLSSSSYYHPTRPEYPDYSQPPSHPKHPASPSFISAPPLLHIQQQHQQQPRDSPLRIPPPLKFNYSASPPQLADNMPPRKKAAGSTATITSTPATVSSTRSSRRIAGSGGAPTSKGNGWTTEYTYDSVGQPKEVVVVHDSASPIPKKRTRAAVAAAAAAADKWTNGLVNGAAAKKRKVEEEEALAKKAKKPASTQAQAVPALPVAQPAAAAAAAAAATTSAAPGQPAVPAWDDPEGHYIVKPDDVIAGRYKIVRLLGQGTFGKVVEARHIESRKKVAIKVIRAVQKYRDASKIEIRVLETLKKNDATNAYKCIHLTEYFDYRNHPCLVSELYGMSVFDFLKLNHFQPFPEKHIQDFAKSLLSSVQFLHSLKLVHTDLKPENILLVHNESRLQGPRRANARSKSILRNTDIRLIDFGSATFENEYHSSVVSTRHYRAPEIILGLPWSYPCDMFSIGCILVEFFTGDALFQTHDNLEHLAMMEVVMGKMPARMVERGRLKKPEFFKGHKIDFPNPSVSKSSRKFVKGLKSLRDIIPSTNNTNALFLDLIVRLLDFDPELRIDVNKALDHPYLRANIPEPP